MRSRKLINFFTDGFTDRLVGRVVPHLEIGMVQRLFAADAFGRVEAEHLGEEVDGERVCVWEKRGEGDSGLDGERPNVVLSLEDTSS